MHTLISESQRHPVVTTRRPDHDLGPPLGPRLVAESIGTFFLVLTVCILTVRTASDSGGVLAPVAVGAVLTAMVFAAGHVSGGHFNPAVSLAVLVRGKLSGPEWLGYVAAQLLSGVLGGLVARFLAGSGHPAVTPGSGKVLAAETLFTFALAYVVLNVATARNSEGNSYFGLAIGLTVVAGAVTVGRISRGVFNPAAALGLAIAGSCPWGQLWIYVVASVAGGGAAAFAFASVQPGEHRRLSFLRSFD